MIKILTTCIEHSDVTTMCRVCRDRDMAVINGKEYSADLAEYSESRGNPNLTVISESGLYRILAKCNLPKCEPWFVAKDACDCLGITNVSQACQTLDEDEKGIYKVYTLGGSQDMMLISESGLYTFSPTTRSNRTR